MVTISDFGKSKQFIIDNGILQVVLLNYGARIAELHFAGKNLCLGYDRFEDFESSEVYVGTTVGRYANRISGGKFELDGVEYKLDANEFGSTCLHGGSVGLDQKFWEGEIAGENSVRFHLLSPDGDMGFPGNMSVFVTFTVEDNALTIHYAYESDKDTVANVTCHSYYNLDGYDGEICTNMILQLNADNYLPTNEKLLPIGEIRSVEGTDFDFRRGKKVDGDYDHCFILGGDRAYRKAGSLFSPKSKIRMDFETDLPALQIYSAYRLEDNAGKGGTPLHFYQALAIEPEMYPDSPNHPEFPSTVLKKGEVVENTSRFIFYQEA